MHASLDFFLYIKAVIFDQWRRRSALLQYIYHKNLVLQKAVKPSQSLLATKGKIDWPGCNVKCRLITTSIVTALFGLSLATFAMQMADLGAFLSFLALQATSSPS